MLKNYLKYISVLLIAGGITGCSKTKMDEINRNLNSPLDVSAANELPSVIVESAVGTTGTDLAWYASVFTEQNAGSYGQLRDADTRTAATASSLFNNNWNALYDNLMILKDIIAKTSPTGSEPTHKATLGIAQVLTAYNLAVATDVWGQVPWTEALMGSEKVQPAYDKQEFIYKNVLFKYLNDAIANLSQPVAADMKTTLAKQDLVYGGNTAKWIKAAWSLKARYFMHMQKMVPTAVDSALVCVSKGFASAADGLVFNKYEKTAIGENPWYQFLYDRSYLVAGQTLYDLMAQRNDPRIPEYFVSINSQGTVDPAPNGAANQSFSGDEYSYSYFSALRTAPTPLMTYHELKFIEAEALARKGQDFTAALKEGIKTSFEFHASQVPAADAVPYNPNYYVNEVQPRLGTTLQSQLKEILTQKYIAMYEAEAIEVYNDYRRTRVPDMHNPNNSVANYGFVERYAYPTSEVSANGANVPKVNVFKDKTWWAGGTE